MVPVYDLNRYHYHVLKSADSLESDVQCNHHPQFTATLII